MNIILVIAAALAGFAAGHMDKRWMRECLKVSNAPTLVRISEARRRELANEAVISDLLAQKRAEDRGQR